MTEHADPIITGNAIGSDAAFGKARVIRDVSEISTIKPGEILVADMTDPDWVRMYLLFMNVHAVYNVCLSHVMLFSFITRYLDFELQAELSPTVEDEPVMLQLSAVSLECPVSLVQMMLLKSSRRVKTIHSIAPRVPRDSFILATARLM